MCKQWKPSGAVYQRLKANKDKNLTKYARQIYAYVKKAEKYEYQLFGEQLQTNIKSWTTEKQEKWEELWERWWWAEKARFMINNETQDTFQFVSVWLWCSRCFIIPYTIEFVFNDFGSIVTCL